MTSHTTHQDVEASKTWDPVPTNNASAGDSWDSNPSAAPQEAPTTAAVGSFKVENDDWDQVQTTDSWNAAPVDSWNAAPVDSWNQEAAPPKPIAKPVVKKSVVKRPPPSSWAELLKQY